MCSDYYHGDQRYDYKTQYDSYKYQEPNSTIMVRGLALHLNENDVSLKFIFSFEMYLR